MQINAGRTQEAEDLLDAVLNGGGRAPNLGAYVARGTARALQRKLEGMLQVMATILKVPLAGY